MSRYTVNKGLKNKIRTRLNNLSNSNAAQHYFCQDQKRITDLKAAENIMIGLFCEQALSTKDPKTKLVQD